MTVRASINAAYEAHHDSGKSHAGCVIVLGKVGNRALLAKGKDRSRRGDYRASSDRISVG